MTCGSLFSGIGGMDLGLERAGFKVIWQSEIDPYASSVLKRHWPDVPNLGDIRAIDWSRVERPNLVCGGFPCQDISTAGKGAGLEGERSGLWAEFVQCLRHLRPDRALVENVPALTFRGLGRVLGDLAEIGFDAEWSTLSACVMGAPHTRERLFIVAYPHSLRPQADTPETCVVQAPERTEQAKQLGRMGGPTVWDSPRPIGAVPLGVGDRRPGWVHRIRICGNAVVPQVAEWIGRRILESVP